VLVFFVTRGEDHTLRDFFDTWARRLREQVILVHYDDLTERDTIPGASAYFFTDIERLTPTGVRLTARLADALSATVPAPRILNHPRSVLRRYEFLRIENVNLIWPHRDHLIWPHPKSLVDARSSGPPLSD
jgi:hypothetical protein